MFFRKGQALGSVQVTDSGEPDEKKAVSMADQVGSGLAPSSPGVPNIADAKAEERPAPDPVATSPESSELERPKVADPKADWIEYAVSKGMDRELAEDHSTTKQDLIDSYGG